MANKWIMWWTQGSASYSTLAQINKFFLFMAIAIFASCSKLPTAGDRRIKAKDAPEFLKKYRSPEYKDVEYYEKQDQGHKIYEVKYEGDKDGEVSIAFDEKGNMLEQEEDIRFASLGLQIQKKILDYVNLHYPGMSMLEVEKRKNNKQQSFIDVEIRHGSSPSGYWELTFSSQGEYISKEIEDFQTVDTLN